MKRKITVIAAAIAMVAVIGVFALGTNREPSGNIPYQEDEQQPYTAAVPADTEEVDYEDADYENANVDYVSHFRDPNAFIIFTSRNTAEHLENTARALRRYLEEQGIDKRVEFDYYLPIEWESVHGLLLSKFAAGAGPDIVLWSSATLHPFIANGFLADIYTVIDQTVHVERDDFFTNVLEGLEINGRLYLLPIQFGFDFIGINENVPAPFLERFLALDRANFTDITTLYLDLISEYPEWAERAIIHDLNPHMGLWAELMQGINFAERTVDLSHITGLLENIRPAFYDHRRSGNPQHIQFNRIVDFQVIQEQYVFSRGMFGGVVGLLEFRDHPFVNYVPLASENGKIADLSWSHIDFVISRDANPDIAMKFISLVISSEFITDRNIEVAIPILRRYFHEGLETRLRNRIGNPYMTPPLAADRFEAMADAIARLEEYNTWPSTTANFHRVLPWPPVLAIFTEFMESDMPAYEAISRMEAVITNMLEEAPAIEPFVPLQAEILYQPGLPTRTLTILADHRYTAVISQAANAMNRDWRERDIPYNFRVEVDSSGFRTPEESEATAARLRAELMAGQGPDMLMINPWFFMWGALDYHGLINSGFLLDINTLMAADPGTNRDKFFTQALTAFEVNGGLYGFPLSFGFEYLAVNAGLPPAFINRFTSKTSISLMEMMEFYLDLMDEYTDEFGHLAFATNSILTFRDSLLQSIIGDFVDFGTRRSNLTDPRFIEILEVMGRIDSWSDRIRGIWAGVYTGESLQGFAAENVFHVSGLLSFNKFNAFFEAEEPVFKHHIPVVDAHGRLLINRDWNAETVWAEVYVTAGSDGELAWEFIPHLVYAFTNPVGRAAACTVTGMPVGWGSNSLSTPILRHLFEDHALYSFEDIFYRWGDHMQTYVGFDNPANRVRQFETAVNRIAVYNEQPMAVFNHMIPERLIEEHLDQFMLGLIDAQTAAQRMHNAVSLWLIE